MDRIQKTIDRLPSMSPAELGQLGTNVRNTLRKNPDDPAALRIREAMESAFAGSPPANLMMVDGIGWEPHGPATMNGYAGGRVVARIHKRENHNSRNDGVYEVEVRGICLDEFFRHVADARLAAGRAFRGGNSP